MSKFKDNEEREWDVAINVPTIKVVRAGADLDLGDDSSKTFDRLAEDVVLLVDVLWLLCERQATERNVTEESFGESLIGDAIDRAASALIQARVDFSRGRKRSLLQLAMKKTEEVQERAHNLAMKKLKDPELMTKVEKAMEEKLDREIEEALTRLNSATS